ASLQDIMVVGDELVTHMAHALAEEMPRELRLVGRDPAELLALEPPFPRISYDEAVELLNEQGVEMYWGDDFGRTQEEPLSRSFEKPVWVVGFPTGIK
ncbi:MAG: asparagine--tRNA ligase, partial [Thermoplasmata archaeon]|nr:asparagine--tRNA ligase [Thermoplasmata archaeon]NIS11826.1 asparagine--tRNA ligase [Thermoplasmata archaeon]NIT76905.1 asparagine--tRNA ligase [Thermoplasmata archaeon]NIV78488.1 asparagine--tRNA ligase [Thermoplasmata archaeon]NIW88529.1 asparagine--tRNA ligase [Thermoplasmata archaeon]